MARFSYSSYSIINAQQKRVRTCVWVITLQTRTCCWNSPGQSQFTSRIKGYTAVLDLTVSKHKQLQYEDEDGVLTALREEF